MVSSIPGIETGAPERTESSRGRRIAEALPVALQLARRHLRSGRRARRERAAAPHVLDAGGGRDREAAWHPVGAEDARHLGEVCALVAEQLAHLRRAFFERVDPLRVRFERAQLALGGCGWLSPQRLTPSGPPAHESWDPRGSAAARGRRGGPFPRPAPRGDRASRLRCGARSPVASRAPLQIADRHRGAREARIDPLGGGIRSPRAESAVATRDGAPRTRAESRG